MSRLGALQTVFVIVAAGLPVQPVPIVPLKLLFNDDEAILPKDVKLTVSPMQIEVLFAVKLILHPGNPDGLYVIILAIQPG